MPVEDDDKDALLKELGHTPTAFESFSTANKGASNEDQLKKAYQQFTGREADAAGLAAHLKNPGGLQGGLQAIYASPESQAFGRKDPSAWGGIPIQPTPTTQPTSNTMPVGGGAAPAVTPARTPVTASTFTGFQPKYAMEGFDTQREQNTGKSAKDAFAYLANQAPPPPLNDKAALGAWFNQYIKPGMDELGHTVTSVDGDKFGFKNWQGEFNVDYGRGAGAEGGALAWQVDDPSAKLSNGAYTPAAAASANPALTDAITGGDKTDPSAMARIKAEIEALMAGGAVPSDNEALLAQLQV